MARGALSRSPLARSSIDGECRCRWLLASSQLPAAHAALRVTALPPSHRRKESLPTYRARERTSGADRRFTHEAYVRQTAGPSALAGINSGGFESLSAQASCQVSRCSVHAAGPAAGLSTSPDRIEAMHRVVAGERGRWRHHGFSHRLPNYAWPRPRPARTTAKPSWVASRLALYTEA